MRAAYHLMLMVMVSCLIFTSCEHKELCYHHPHVMEVRVKFDGLEELEQKPEAMGVLFYSQKDGSSYAFDLQIQGGIVRVPYGTYDVLTYSLDTENVVAEEKEEGLVLYTIPRSLKSHSCLVSPDYMCGCVKNSVYVQKNNDSRVQIVELYLRPIVSRCTFEIHGVKNLAYARQIKGCLSGTASSLLLNTDELQFPLSGSMFVNPEIHGDVIVGKFYLWGFMSDGEIKKHVFTLNIVNHIKNILATFDVTNQIYTFPAEGNIRNVHIIIETDVEIPKPIGEGGFQPDVEDWESEEEDIVL